MIFSLHSWHKPELPLLHTLTSSKYVVNSHLIGGSFTTDKHVLNMYKTEGSLLLQVYRGYFYFSPKQMEVWDIKERIKRVSDLEEDWEGRRSQGQ